MSKKKQSDTQSAVAWYGCVEVTQLMMLEYAAMLLDRMMTQNVSPKSLANASGISEEIIVATLRGTNADLDTDTVARLSSPLGMFMVFADRAEVDRLKRIHP